MAKRDFYTNALTRRQSEVLNLISTGQTDKEIARQLGISPRTVEDHKADIYRKMNVRNAAQLVCIVLTARIRELEAAQ